MRWKLGSIQLAVNESPSGCLKTHCQGFTEPSVLEEETPEGEGSYPVSIPHTGSSASNLDQVTITFCLTIGSKLVSCFPSGIPMIHICLHSRQKFFLFFWLLFLYSHSVSDGTSHFLWGRTALKDFSCFGPAVWHGVRSVWNQSSLGGNFVLAAG